MFPHVYFAARYFPTRYFPGPLGLVEPKYFPHTYFALRYFPDRYFPGPDLVVVTPPTPTPDRAAVGGGRPHRIPRTIRGHGRLWLQPLELEATGRILDPVHGEGLLALHALECAGHGAVLPDATHGAGQATTARLGLTGSGKVAAPAPRVRAKPRRRPDEDDENDLLDWWSRN